MITLSIKMITSVKKSQLQTFISAFYGTEHEGRAADTLTGTPSLRMPVRRKNGLFP
jgi:hypothetical protein